MNKMNTIDARGLSCPQPAMLARQAIQKTDRGTIEVLVDSFTARENVSRIARNLGWAVTIEDESDGNYKIVIKK